MLDHLRAAFIVHVRSERGASVTEYAILLAGVAFALTLVVVAWTHGLSDVFTFYKDDVEENDMH